MQHLKPDEDLEDEIIQMYSKYLMEKFQSNSCRFYICDIIWTKKMMENNIYTYAKVKRYFDNLLVNILDLEFLYFPFHKVCICYIIKYPFKLIMLNFIIVYIYTCINCLLRRIIILLRF